MMYSEKEDKSVSKFLSLVLRHQPEVIGIDLDENGWTDVEQLIAKVQNHGIKLTREWLEHIVDTNAKKRFAFNESKRKIRASQGHSITVDLGYVAQVPPEVLYHGTAIATVGSIFQTGIDKRARQHVHLSSDIETAIKVGQRHGKPLVLEVAAQLMHNENFEFFLSENGVWLTDHVPPQYLRQRDV